jgi:hypothetical protein
MQKLGVQLYGTCRRRKLKRKPSFIGQSPSDEAPLPSCTLSSASPQRRSKNALYRSKFEQWYTWAFEKVWGPPRWKSAAFWNGSCSAHWYSVTNRFCYIIPSMVRGRFRRAVGTYEHQALSELKSTLQLFGSVMQSSSNNHVYLKWFDRKIRKEIWGIPLGRPKSRWQDNIKMDLSSKTDLCFSGVSSPLARWRKCVEFKGDNSEKRWQYICSSSTTSRLNWLAYLVPLVHYHNHWRVSPV